MKQGTVVAHLALSFCDIAKTFKPFTYHTKNFRRVEKKHLSKSLHQYIEAGFKPLVKCAIAAQSCKTYDQ